MSNQLSGAEAFVRLLQQHDVKHVFGLCGDTSLPLYDALFRLDHGMTHILSRDERSASYMADGYARVTGKVGICEGPSGGGATYILPGVVEANESSIPILAVTTDISVGGRGRYTLTELDQEALFRPLSKWNRMLNRAVDIPRVVRSAFTHMTSAKPGSAHIGLPFDVQKDPVDEADVWADRALGSYPSRRFGPDPEMVARAAEALLSAKNPIFICGGGVVIAGAEAALVQLAEWLGAAVATTISGQGSIPEDHPLATGVVGSNGGTPMTRALVDMADLVIFVGCRAGSVTTERWRHPLPGKARVVHIDADPGVFGATYQTQVAMLSDARLALEAILAEVKTAPRPTIGRMLDAAAIAKAKLEKFGAFNALAQSDDAPIRPERVVATLQKILPNDAVIVCDPGTPCPYFSGYYEFKSTGRHFISNRAHGALGYSMSAAVGAWYGRPQSKVLSIMGDGSFGFTVGEMETIVRQKVPLTMIVFSNSVYGWIKAGQKTGFDSRYFSVDFSRTDHAKVAEAFGVKAWTVRDPADLETALRQAIDHDGPTLVDIHAQPLQDAKAPVSEWVA
ncbi:acetolactate synthase-1/2/3 large subunit [Stella humosa]|uniref:Acetolactate synthase-1/2/3 large subunit n=1 Tax=Stella humosa TaxID=94 RepID=A0A3N1KV88_9PROT|nr:thiamine pyrophosphate-binding protein [Stella humosa]ROP84501.1 acetolactate synthase-1/2/3 large subunit [Stella humosa]BBK34021.1 acetolactate synthase [Stella humosa]